MKYYGLVGYATIEENDDTGVHVENIVERSYYGDVLRNSAGWQGAEYLNDDRKVNVQISIVADPYALQHFSDIRYVHWMGNKWKVSTVTPAFPRLVLDIGGVYNEQTT